MASAFGTKRREIFAQVDVSPQPDQRPANPRDTPPTFPTHQVILSDGLWTRRSVDIRADAPSHTHALTRDRGASDPARVPGSPAHPHSHQSTFKPARVFRKHLDPGRSFTSLSFDDKGELLLTAADDETMQLFNARTGK